MIEYTSYIHKHGMVSSHVNSIAEQSRNIHVLHFRLTINYLDNQGWVPQQKWGIISKGNMGVSLCITLK